MRFELFVALRYLLAPRRQARVSLVSLFSTIGVAVGVMALVIALALMTGLQGELRDRILESRNRLAEAGSSRSTVRVALRRVGWTTDVACRIWTYRIHGNIDRDRSSE